jgi:hypothetical protein
MEIINLIEKDFCKRLDFYANRSKIRRNAITWMAVTYL